MDNLIELSKQLNAPLTTQHRIDISGEVSDQGLAKTYRKHKIQVDLYKTFISITIFANSELAFAINKPDLLFGYRTPLNRKDYSYTVYTSENGGDFLKEDSGRAFLDEVLGFLQSISLSDTESVHFYRNAIRVVINPVRDVKKILDGLIGLVEEHRLVFKTRSKQVIAEKNIPDDLKALFPFLQKYAISDDSDRAELVKGMSGKEKKELIDRVSPLFAQINSYLNSFGKGALTEEAMLIGNLAELVSELI